MRKLFEAVQLAEAGQYRDAQDLAEEICADPEVDPDIRERADELAQTMGIAYKNMVKFGRGPRFQIAGFLLRGLPTPSLGD